MKKYANTDEIHVTSSGKSMTTGDPKYAQKNNYNHTSGDEFTVNTHNHGNVRIFILKIHDFFNIRKNFTESISFSGYAIISFRN